MRQVLGDTLRRVGVNEESVADILLAASEACTNVVRHAGRAVADYAVAATVEPARCRVEVIDTGGGCRSPNSRRPPPTAESGRGFEVMRACVDGVSLRSAPGEGTVVTLVKRITWDALSPRGDDPPVGPPA
jgi:serine/threonine-protein kinase RsbW